MRKFYHKIISCILIFTILFSNFKVTEVQAAENQSFSEILKDRLGITSYENQKKMMKDTFNSLLESIGISYDDKNQLEEDFQDTLDMMKLNIQEWYDFCYDFTIRRLFQGKENIDKLINNKIIRNNEKFGEMYNRFSNIIFNTLNKKYYYLSENNKNIVNKDFEYSCLSANYSYSDEYKEFWRFNNNFKFNIVDVETFKISSDEILNDKSIFRKTKFNNELEIITKNVKKEDNKLIECDFSFWVNQRCYYPISNNMRDYMGIGTFNFNSYPFYNEKFNKDTFIGNKKDLLLSNYSFNYNDSGFLIDMLIYNLFKCEYYHKESDTVRTFYIGDITNDFGKVKNYLLNIGYLRDGNIYGINFNLDTYYKKVQNITPLKPEYVMRPYNNNYYTTQINHNFDTSDLQKNIVDYINEHLKNYDYSKDFENGMNSLKSNYNYNSAIISDNQVKLSNQLTDLQNNFNEQYNYLNDLLNDFIDNKYRKQQQELSDKLDKLIQNVDNNKSILQENNQVLKSYDSELKGLSENLQVLSLNSDNNYKSLNKKVDDIYNKLNNLGDVSNPKSDIDLSEIKRLNDRIKEINETDPKDRIGDSISMLDRFIDFVKNFFTVNEKIEIQKLDTFELSKKFPFSIFTDIKNIFQSLVKPPKVPIFEFPLFTEKIVLDFNNFQELAAIIRTFTLLTFIVAIALKMNNKAG